MQEKTKQAVIKLLQQHSLLLIRKCALHNTKSCAASVNGELDRSTEALESLVQSDSYLKKRVPDVLSNAVIRYGVRLLKLSAFSDLFLPDNGYNFTALFYEVYGSDVLKFLDSVGRPVVLYKGYPFDKVEVGNRLEIPWPLVDSIEELTTRQLVLDCYLVGVVGNKALSDTLGSGHPNLAKPTRKQIDQFESFLKRFNKEKQPTKVELDIAATSKKPKAYSAAQAKSSYSWVDAFKN